MISSTAGAIISVITLWSEFIGIVSLPEDCFVDKNALQSAVADFLSEGCKTNPSCQIQITRGMIQNWCTSLIDDMSHLFAWRSSFNEDISGWNTSRVSNMDSMFYSAVGFNQDLSRWDTSRVTNMERMFAYAHEFNGDITSWNISRVTTTAYMFAGKQKFNQDISAWNMSLVTTMAHMFDGTFSFNQDISSWDTGRVTNMEGIFLDANEFNGDITDWDTSKVSTMSNMFYLAKAFNQDISGWNTSTVTDMSAMFSVAYAFNQDISGWDTSAVTNMARMFDFALAFNQDISGWNTSRVRNMDNMFFEAASFNQNLCPWKNNFPFNSSRFIFHRSGCIYQSSPLDPSSTFCHYCSVPTYSDGPSQSPSKIPTQNPSDSPTKNPAKSMTQKPTELPSKNPSRNCFLDKADLQGAVDSFVKDHCTTFSSCGVVMTWGPINDWCTSLISDMSFLFQDTRYDFNADISDWDTSRVTNMEGMFQSAFAFNQDISSWNTSSVTNMESMFNLATSFNQHISGWNTRHVTSMAYMFHYAHAFNQDLLDWNTSSVIDMSHMFAYASVFNGSISQWNTARVTSMTGMFLDNQVFNQDISGWNTASVKNMGSMFQSATAFNQDISHWNISSVVEIGSMFFYSISFNQDLCGWKENFPYSSASGSQLFFYSGCTYWDTPTDSLSAFCAAEPNCVVMKNMTESIPSNSPTGGFDENTSCHASNVRSVLIASTSGKQIQMFEFYAYTESGEEVAQGKNATQSSTYNQSSQFAASRALDGDYSTFSHTSDVAPSWEVNLAHDYNISFVSIKNRYCGRSFDKTDCLCKLSYATVMLLDSERNVVGTSSFGNTCGDVNPFLSFNPCFNSCLVRKVKLESTTKKQIQIFELQAFSSGENVALLGYARQSSLLNGNIKFRASHAIDGINSTFSHTKDMKAWIEIALTAPVRIDYVVILNRWCVDSSDPNGCLCRLSYSRLTLYNEFDSPVSTTTFGSTCDALVVAQEILSCPDT